MTAPDDFVRECLRAFERLDLDAFIEGFAQDATAFFPEPEPPARVEGREAIRARFDQVFAGVRSRAASGPPWHRLDAEDLQLQWLGPDIAVATFHMADAVRLARRTFVLARAGDRWRIVHLHASNAPAR